MGFLRQLAHLLIVLPLLLVTFSCTGGKEPLKTETAFVLGTTCSISLDKSTEPDMFTRAFTLLREIEEIMSTSIPGSDVMRINENAGRSPVAVTEDTYYVIAKSLEISRTSKGVFDITVGPLVDLWKIGTPEAAVPDPVRILEALPLVDFESVLLDPEHRTVYLEQENMRVDLGGIAKGFAADKVVEYLNSHSIEKGIIDLGGNIFAMGTKHDGTPWRIGVQDPDGSRGSYIGIIKASNQAVVTSGIYERYFIEQGHRYHHIIDTETGYPVESGVVSVSIVSGNAMEADALSTALFALGVEQGLDYIETFPGAEALFVTREKEVFLSSGMTGLFTITNTSYSIISERSPVASGEQNDENHI